MLEMLNSRYHKFFVAWVVFSTGITIAVGALLLAYGTVIFYAADGPVVETSDVRLFTPRIPVGGTLSYSLWRKSYESCPGDVVTTFEPLDESNRERGVFAVRRPISTPGYNSPPPLTLHIQTPPLTPGRWRARGSLDSRCPARHKTDRLFDFVIEVYPNERSDNAG